MVRRIKHKGREWERILDALDELDAVRAYDKVKSGSQVALLFEQAVREVTKNCR